MGSRPFELFPSALGRDSWFFFFWDFTPQNDAIWCPASWRSGLAWTPDHREKASTETSPPLSAENGGKRGLWFMAVRNWASGAAGIELH